MRKLEIIGNIILIPILIWIAIKVLFNLGAILTFLCAVLISIVGFVIIFALPLLIILIASCR